LPSIRGSNAYIQSDRSATLLSLDWLLAGGTFSDMIGDIMPSGSSKQGFIGGALVSLMITLLLSFGAIYSLNRYLDSIEDPPTSSLRHPPTN
jgi:hypothetical protein